MAGVAIMMRRAGMSPHPSYEEEVDVMQYCVGAYTFENCVNGENIVADKSGKGHEMVLYNMNWGYQEPVYDVKEGFFNDHLYMDINGSAYGHIVLSAPLADFTIIAERQIYSIGINKEWVGLIGSGIRQGYSPIHIEYTSDRIAFESRSDIAAIREAPTAIPTSVTWMTNTHYNGKRMTDSETSQISDVNIYINRYRGDVTPGGPMKLKCLYIFNKILSYEELQSFIKGNIDADYIMPEFEE